MRAAIGMANLPELTLDFDDTLNKRLDLKYSQGLDPRLLAIIKQFGRFTVVTHRNFEKSTINSVNALNALSDKKLPITPKSMEGHFIPTFLRSFSKDYPRIEYSVCVEGSAREGFGEVYTDALLQFEEELLAALLTLNENIDKIIPTFKHNLKWLMTTAEKSVNENLSSEFSALLELDDIPNFLEFYQRVEVFIEGKKEQIEDLARKLLNGFYTCNKLPKNIADLVKAKQEKFSDAANVSAAATLISLQLKQKLVTAYEARFDKDNRFAKANHNKAKQFEYVKKSSGANEIFHIDDSEKVASLRMDGVRVFLYEPRCVEEQKFIDDPRVHQWFFDFQSAMDERDPAVARKIRLQGQHMAETEWLAAFSEKFTQIIVEIRRNEDIPSLNKNYLLYALFLQRMALFQNELGVTLIDKDQDSDSMLREDQHFLSFIKSYLELRGRKENELFGYLEKILAFVQIGLMQILKAQLPELDFDCIKGALLDDLIKFTFIKPEEHSAYENKREHDSFDRRQINLVKSRFYRKENGSPEAFRAALESLLQDFSKKYSQFENNNNEVAKVDENPNANNPINLLPSDILQSQITKRLGTEDVFSLNATCRFFRGFFKSQRGKPVFERAYNEKFHLELLVEKMGELTQGKLSPVKCVFAGSAALKGRAINCYTSSQANQTIGVDFSLKEVKAGGATLNIELRDTVDLEEYQFLAHHFLKNGHIAVCVLSPYVKDSFDVKGWLKEIDRVASAVNAGNPPLKLVLYCEHDLYDWTPLACSSFTTSLREKFGSDLLCHRVSLDQPASVKEALDRAIGLYIEKNCLPALESAQKAQIEEAKSVVEEGAGKCLLM